MLHCPPSDTPRSHLGVSEEVERRCEWKKRVLLSLQENSNQNHHDQRRVSFSWWFSMSGVRVAVAVNSSFVLEEERTP